MCGENEGEYASDILGEVDFDVSTKGVGVRFAKASHATVTRAQANTLRAAYLSGGWNGLRAAWVQIDARAGTWLDSFDADEREGLVYQVSARTELPAPPP